MKTRSIILRADEVRATLAGNMTVLRLVRPIGSTGKQLYVREVFCVVDDREHGGKKWIDYEATPRYPNEGPGAWGNDPDHPDALKWQPASQMLRRHSRITIELTSVRPEYDQRRGTTEWRCAFKLVPPEDPQKEVDDDEEHERNMKNGRG